MKAGRSSLPVRIASQGNFGTELPEFSVGSEKNCFDSLRNFHPPKLVGIRLKVVAVPSFHLLHWLHKAKIESGVKSNKPSLTDQKLSSLSEMLFPREWITSQLSYGLQSM